MWYYCVLTNHMSCTCIVYRVIRCLMHVNNPVFNVLIDTEYLTFDALVVCTDWSSQSLYQIPSTRYHLPDITYCQIYRNTWKHSSLIPVIGPHYSVSILIVLFGTQTSSPMMSSSSTTLQVGRSNESSIAIHSATCTSRLLVEVAIVMSDYGAEGRTTTSPVPPCQASRTSKTASRSDWSTVSVFGPGRKPALTRLPARKGRGKGADNAVNTEKLWPISHLPEEEPAALQSALQSPSTV